MDSPQINYKHCRKCNTTQPAAEFYRDASKKDGLQACCKACSSANHKQWVINNAERDAENKRKWREKNLERHAACVRVNDAKRLARSANRASRYIRAFGYFEGRQGWTASLAAILLREKRLHEMAFKNPALEEYIAEYA